MKPTKTQTPAFPPIPKSTPAPPLRTGPQPDALVIRFRTADGRFQPARKGQPAVQEEEFEALDD